MILYLAAYAATLVVFLVVDAAYLGTIGVKTFKGTLGDVMAADVVVTPAILFYALFPIGIVYFAVMPALQDGRWTTALLNGALFGFFAYLTYDMTNWATIRNWTAALAIQDVVWGTFLTGLSATAGFYAVRWFGLQG